MRHMVPLMGNWLEDILLACYGVNCIPPKFLC